MLIVSDTSPLRYLVEVGVIEVLPRLYGEILTTPQVLSELRQGQFPIRVREWADSPPVWLRIESPTEIRFLDKLDIGEAAALSLAIERRADILLVDERLATCVAHDCGLATAGTLAVLRDAAVSGMIDFRQAIEHLTDHTRFHHTRALIERVIAEFESQTRNRGRAEPEAER